MPIRRKYLLPNIDMAPFVSVALLLLMFFMWAKAVLQPNVLSVWDVQGCRKGIEPERSKGELEILLLDNDTIQFRRYPVGSVCRANFVTAPIRSTRLRQTLIRHRKESLTPGELAIVIRPMAKSTFGNFVDVLDELRIAGNLPYLLDY